MNKDIKKNEAEENAVLRNDFARYKRVMTKAKELDTEEKLKNFIKLHGVADDTRVFYLFTQISRIPFITDEREAEISEILAAGGDKDSDEIKKARAELVREAARIVICIAADHVGKGLSFPDLIVDGCAALYDAVCDFGFAEGKYRFTEFAVWFIDQSLLRSVAKTCKIIQDPPYPLEVFHNVSRCIREFRDEFGRDPSPEEISRLTVLPVSKVNDILKIIGKAD